MTISVRFKMSAFEKAAKDMQGQTDQVRFALSRSLNDAAEVARKELIEDVWPSHINARNKNFLKASLTTKGHRSTKRDLRVAIVDQLDRGNLVLHADGGTKSPRGSNLAVPSQTIASRRSGRGVPKALRPRNLPNSFVKGDVIYQRIGKKGRSLKLAYVLKKKVSIRKDVPFREAFRDIMGREINKAFTTRFAQAMKTRK